ncbi:thymidylate kinase [Candidatus Photodesmus katoptron]|uniref:Thymidylate kinase n=1 Tax=Candidatus Photodesmus katoptron Akat1 TaxID=1236703 RepID=S3DIU7_9GAMM|nr:dTMP kinase [Candidatus Photodesmus katoptron]EPE37640.1 thymidylate kinase [Candidatus Photodesmus katoptron Akat1]KEY90640.1 thymidylate kinase [Candidatus Photodesmus katoptron]
MKKAKFIVVEGLEGSGKSTAVKIISTTLTNAGILKVKSTREPGGTNLAEKIRLLIKEEPKNESLQNMTELLLLYAARVQSVEHIIKPALSKGIWVVSDRHDMSSQTYQGAGRNISSNILSMLKETILVDLIPDLTFYLDLDPKIGLERVYSRDFGKVDRIEKMDIDFFNRTRECYLKLANEDCNTVIIDAEQNMVQVANDIRNILNTWLNIR